MNDNIKLMVEKLREGVEIETIPQILATLFQDDNLVAKGIAAISPSDTYVHFAPESPKSLDGILHGKVVLKTTRSDASINLKHSQDLLEASSDSDWFFERVA